MVIISVFLKVKDLHDLRRILPKNLGYREQHFRVCFITILEKSVMVLNFLLQVSELCSCNTGI